MLGLKLDYTSAGSDKNYYNGNVPQMSWSTLAGTKKNYVFSYDNLNRLTGSTSTEYTAGNQTASGRFNEAYTYDANGNFKTVLL